MKSLSNGNMDIIKNLKNSRESHFLKISPLKKVLIHLIHLTIENKNKRFNEYKRF